LKKQLKLYTNRDFRESERLERIYMAMMEPERFESLLTFEEEDYRRRLEQAYQRCFKELGRSAAIKYIQENVAGCETLYKASRVLDDMQKLFGRFLDKNLTLQKSLVVERMYESYQRMHEYAQTLYEDGNHGAAIEVEERAMNILEKAAKLQGLDKVSTGFKPEDFELPEIVVSSDARLLKGDIEDVEVEEEE